MLFSMDLPNILSSKSSSTTFQVRIGPYFSIMIMLALMFVIPHDPSTSLEEVGSEAYRLTPRYVHKQQTSDLSQPRHPSKGAVVVTQTLLTSEHPDERTGGTARILRLARSGRPVLKIARAASSSIAAAPCNYRRRPSDERRTWRSCVQVRSNAVVGRPTPFETRPSHALPKKCAHDTRPLCFCPSLRACVCVEP